MACGGRGGFVFILPILPFCGEQMSEQRLVRIPAPIQIPDPAGADKAVLAAAEAGCHWMEAFIQTSMRVQVDLWNGPNGLRGVVEEAVKNAGVPNKRFAEIVTPRLIAEKAGIVPARRRKRGSR